MNNVALTKVRVTCKKEMEGGGALLVGNLCTNKWHQKRM